MDAHGIALHDLHLEDLQNPFHPSSFEEHSDYSILILALPEIVKRKPHIRAYGFVITDSSLYYYDPELSDLALLPGGLNDMHRLLDGKIDPIMADVERVAERIVAMEENLYKRFSRSFMNHWHDLKKELSRTERILRKAVVTLERFIFRTKGAEGFPLNEFGDLYEHMERTLLSVAAANEQLDGLFQYYNLRSSDRLNRSIYILTVISVIFLPLNLVVGFFGMNTGGLPFAEHPSGTFYAFVTMIVFAALLSVAVLWKIRDK